MAVNSEKKFDNYIVIRNNVMKCNSPVLYSYQSGK